VAEHAIGAYRDSGHRLLAIMSRNLDRGTRHLTPRLTEALRRTSAKVSDVAAKGIDTVSDRTERVIERGSAGVTARIERVADLVEGIENRYVVTGLQGAARFSLTGAQAALIVSEKLAAGADKLASVVGGKRVRGTKAVARAKTAVRAARRAAAPAKAKAEKAVKAVAKRTKAVKAVKAAKAAARKPAAGPVARKPRAKAARRAAAPAEQAPAQA
jgi:hypothetical protein